MIEYDIDCIGVVEISSEGELLEAIELRGGRNFEHGNIDLEGFMTLLAKAGIVDAVETVLARAHIVFGEQRVPGIVAHGRDGALGEACRSAGSAHTNARTARVPSAPSPTRRRLCGDSKGKLVSFLSTDEVHLEI